ncbi:NF038104 family lipoprotein [Candidatus Dependentiae bacterium]|nr:NF038104 family lipoprotein [Candidatus Dependentiae bacterium]
MKTNFLLIKIIFLFLVLFGFGCAVVKLPYTAVKTGYKVTKTAVKGTAAVGKALVPGGGEEEADNSEKDE